MRSQARTTQEIIRLKIRYTELAEIGTGMTREQYREMQAARGQPWRLTEEEEQVALEGPWAHQHATGQIAAAVAAIPDAPPIPGMAEIAAACEIEGTPLAPVAAYTRPIRRCIECGSLIHGDHCTHCSES